MFQVNNKDTRMTTMTPKFLVGFYKQPKTS